MDATANKLFEANFSWTYIVVRRREVTAIVITGDLRCPPAKMINKFTFMERSCFQIRIITDIYDQYVLSTTVSISRFIMYTLSL